VTEIDIARLRAMAGSQDIEIVTDPVEVVVVGHATRDALRPNTIIRIGQQFLVETLDEPGDWYMGQLTGATILCWGRYGSLETAIRSL
jgi:hypothetical protein